MIIAKLLLGIAILLAGISLFLFGPEHGEEALMIAGLDLDYRTATALSIIGMVLGTLLALRFLAEWMFERKDRAKHPA